MNQKLLTQQCQNQGIFDGKDQRIKVKKSQISKNPCNGIGTVQVKYRSQDDVQNDSGIASILARNIILTSSHVILKKNNNTIQYPSQIHFFPNIRIKSKKKIPNLDLSKQDKGIRVKRYIFPKKYLSKQSDHQDDFCLLQLQLNLHQKQIIKLNLNYEYQKQLKKLIIYTRKSSQRVLLKEQKDCIIPEDECFQYIYYQLSTERGNSGTPILVKMQNQFNIIGIHKGQKIKWNFGISLNFKKVQYKNIFKQLQNLQNIKKKQNLKLLNINYSKQFQCKQLENLKTWKRYFSCIKHISRLFNKSNNIISNDTNNSKQQQKTKDNHPKDNLTLNASSNLYESLDQIVKLNKLLVKISAQQYYSLDLSNIKKPLGQILDYIKSLKQLKKLTILKLNNIQLNDQTLPTLLTNLQTLQELEQLYLQNNKIVDSFRYSYIKQFQKLQIVFLSGNQLSNQCIKQIKQNNQSQQIYIDYLNRSTKQYQVQSNRTKRSRSQQIEFKRLDSKNSKNTQYNTTISKRSSAYLDFTVA